MNRVIWLLIWSLLSFISIYANDYLLYQPRNLGHEALYHPVNFYVNTAFDTIQNPYYFNQKDFYPRHHTVWKRVRDPKREVEKAGGFKKLWQDEFVGKRAFPNYFIHFLGEGYDYRRLREYFSYHQAEFPTLYATLFTYAAQWGNEALESSNERDITAHDHIADLYVFDLIGKIAFSYDPIVRFVRDDLQFVSWHSQPHINVHDGRVKNASTNFLMRPKLFGHDSRFRPVLFIGMQAMGGVAYKIHEEGELTITQGMAYTDPIRQKGRYATGLFYDRGNQLLTSLFINSTEDFRLRLNLYPGVIQIPQTNWKIGTSFGLYRNYDLMVGVNIEMPLGIGFQVE